MSEGVKVKVTVKKKTVGVPSKRASTGGDEEGVVSIPTGQSMSQINSMVANKPRMPPSGASPAPALPGRGRATPGPSPSMVPPPQRSMTMGGGASRVPMQPPPQYARGGGPPPMGRSGPVPRPQSTAGGPGGASRSSTRLSGPQVPVSLASLKAAGVRLPGMSSEPSLDEYSNDEYDGGSGEYVPATHSVSSSGTPSPASPAPAPALPNRPKSSTGLPRPAVPEKPPVAARPAVPEKPMVPEKPQVPDRPQVPDKPALPSKRSTVAFPGGVPSFPDFSSFPAAPSSASSSSSSLPVASTPAPASAATSTPAASAPASAPAPAPALHPNITPAVIAAVAAAAAAASASVSSASSSSASHLEGEIVPLEWPAGGPFNTPDSQDNLLVDDREEDDNSPPKIKAASLAKLVEKITSPTNRDSTVLQAFLLTYRSFTTSAELLQLLKQRFTQPLPEGNEASVDQFVRTKQKPMQLKVVQFIKSWVNDHFYDFLDDINLLTSLLDFLNQVITPVIGAASQAIITRIQRKIDGSDKDKNETIQKQPPKPILPPRANATFIELHPLEIARQITLIESEMFRKIRPQECIGLAWSKKPELAPNIATIIEQFNYISNWVVTEIVKPDSQKLRVQVMTHFIYIAERCSQLNNLNACMEIISGLGDAAIFRLKSHWAELPKKAQTIYQDLKQILSSDRSYFNLRAYLRNVDMPCIPYLGMYLTDLTFIEEGNKDSLNGLINFGKRRLVSQIISDIQLYQQTTYPLETVRGIRNFLLDLKNKCLSKEDCYQRSLEILPRGLKGDSSGKDSRGAPAGRKSTASNPSAPGSNPSSSSSSSSSAKDEDWGPMQEIKGYKFDEADSDKNITLQSQKDDGSPPRIISGTVVKLIERMTFPKYFPDPQFLEVFLTTYRHFSSPHEFLDLLIMRFNMPRPRDPEKAERYRREIEKTIQFRVINVFKNWIDKFPEDFTSDKTLTAKFVKFSKTSADEQLKRMAKKLLINDPKDSRLPKIPKKGNPPPTHPLGRGSDSDSLRLKDFHHEEVARQLSLLMFSLFFAIRPFEFIANSPKCANLQKFLRYGKNLTRWVTDDVLAEGRPDRPENLINLINLARSCYDLRNHFAAFSILSALSSDELKAQNALWSAVPQKTVERLNEMQTLFTSFQNSFSTYRDALQKQGGPEDPAIPLVSVYLQQIASLGASSFNAQEKAKVDVQVLRKVANVLAELQGFRSLGYNFNEVNWLQTLFHRIVDKSSVSAVEDESPEAALFADPEKVRAHIRSQLTSDADVRGEFIGLLKTILVEQLSDSQQVKAFQSQIDDQKFALKAEFERLRNSMLSSSPEALLSAKAQLLSEQFADASPSVWSRVDEEGSVFGWAQQIDLEVVAAPDGSTHILIERPNIDKAELSVILRIKQFFETQTGSSVNTTVLTGFVAHNTRQIGADRGISFVSTVA